MRNELPELCFSTLPDTGQLITLKRYECGYFPSEWNTDDKAHNLEIAQFQNRKLGITPAQQQAMECGSMFGWTSPGANPQFYLDKAVYGASNLVKGHIKHPTMSVLYPVDGALYHYYIGGERAYYLDLSALPSTFMGRDSDLTLLPDLVRGRPYLPVRVEQSENGSYTFQVEAGSYSFDKEINATYRIIARVQVGPTEFAMGEHPTAPAQFVTWERTPANESDRGKNYYWGHYSSDRTGIIEDFCDRAKTEFDLQQHRRNPPQRDTDLER